MVVQKIVHLTSVNFVVTDIEPVHPIHLLFHDFCPLEQIIHSLVLHSFHSESLSRTSLSISKTSYYTSVKEKVDLRLNGVFVQRASSLNFSKSIVKGKSVVFNCLCDSINLVLALVNENYRVRATDTINLSSFQLLGKSRSFPHADVDF